jgi:hypothetical protein
MFQEYVDVFSGGDVPEQNNVAIGRQILRETARAVRRGSYETWGFAICESTVTSARSDQLFSAPSRFAFARARFACNSAKCFSDHRQSARSGSISVRPSREREYSTRGGTTG